METLFLAKLWSKMFTTDQIAGFFKLWCLKNYLRYDVLFLHVVKSRNVCWVWSGMPGHVQDSPNNKITKPQYLWEGLSYFVYLLHVVTHSWKVQCYHVVLVGYGPACPKFSEATSRQYFLKWSCAFADFSLVLKCILLDIHWNYKNMLFSADIFRHSVSANQIVRCFKLKNSKRIWGIKLTFRFPWN